MSQALVRAGRLRDERDRWRLTASLRPFWDGRDYGNVPPTSIIIKATHNTKHEGTEVGAEDDAEFLPVADQM